MEPKTFQKFREFIYEQSGITLGPGKEALVSARVGKRMRALNIQDHREYLRYVQADQSGQEVVHLIDAISTNVTSFFREPNHFEFTSEAMAKWLEHGQTRFRIWCAAASTGEEPYSIAITLLEASANCSVDIKILATDISTRVLEKCRQGIYQREKLDTVPASLRDRYFTMQRRPDGIYYEAKPQLKRLITFSRLNLATPPFPMRGPLDIVFCRNVMIYFDNRVRGNLLKEVNRLLKPDGHLIVGHAESLTGMMSTFKTVKPSIYVK